MIYYDTISKSLQNQCKQCNLHTIFQAFTLTMAAGGWGKQPYFASGGIPDSTFQKFMRQHMLAARDLKV